MNKTTKTLNRRGFLKSGLMGSVLAALPVGSLLSFPRIESGTRVRVALSRRDPEKIRLKQLISTYGGEFGGFNNIREGD